MAYIVYYNEQTKQMVKNIFWHDTEAYEKMILNDVFTGYRVDTGLKFDTEAEADAKADELNADEEKRPFEDEGDSRKYYYAMDEVPKPQYKEEDKVPFQVLLKK